MSPAGFLLPAAVHDARHPSGGNRYDIELTAALRLAGWRVQLHEVAPEQESLDPVLAALPPDEPVLLDGLLLDHGCSWEDPADRRIVPLLHMPPAAWVTLDGMPGVDAVLTTSSWTADQVRHRLPSSTSIVVAAPGVRPARLVGTSPTGRRLRCVGALLPHKGQDVLVTALGRIRHLAWRCELVGATDLDPAYTRRVAGLAADLGIADRVTFPGARHPNPVDGLYSGADLLILPSLSESYGMAAAEALACGVPVIASDAGGIREALDPTAALLVRAGDPARLAAALTAWLSNSDLRRRLTLAARHASGLRRTWSSSAAIVADLLAAAPVPDPRTSGR